MSGESIDPENGQSPPNTVDMVKHIPGHSPDYVEKELDWLRQSPLSALSGPVFDTKDQERRENKIAEVRALLEADDEYEDGGKIHNPDKAHVAAIASSIAEEDKLEALKAARHLMDWNDRNYGTDRGKVNNIEFGFRRKASKLAGKADQLAHDAAKEYERDPNFIPYQPKRPIWRRLFGNKDKIDPS